MFFPSFASLKPLLKKHVRTRRIVTFFFFTWYEDYPMAGLFTAYDDDCKVKVENDRRERFCDRYLNARMAELNTVMTTAFAVLTISIAAYSWPKYAGFGVASKLAFGTAFILSFASVCKASQLLQMFSRISCCEDRFVRLRTAFGRGSGKMWQPDPYRAGSWQHAIVYLNSSIIAMCVAIAASLFAAAQECQWEWTFQDAKIAYVLLPVGGFMLYQYFSNFGFLYWQMHKS